MVSIDITDGAIEINRLFVHPAHFKQGIAQSLLNYIESHFEAEKIKVSTGTANTPAVKFYEKNGFREAEEIIVEDQLSLTYFLKKSKI